MCRLSISNNIALCTYYVYLDIYLIHVVPVGTLNHSSLRLPRAGQCESSGVASVSRQLRRARAPLCQVVCVPVSVKVLALLFWFADDAIIRAQRHGVDLQRSERVAGRNVSRSTVICHLS